MLGFVILGAAAVALVGFLAVQLRQPGSPSGELTFLCPTCRIPMSPVTSGPSTDPEHVRSYDVLACPSCTNAVTMVHGTRSQWAYCPECQQRTLETPCIRLPSDATGAEQGARVEVREHCHLCSYDATHVVNGAPPTPPEARGQVIHFPRERTRKTP